MNRMKNKPSPQASRSCDFFVKSSRFLQVFEVFGLARTCSNLFGSIRMRSDAFRCVWTISEKFTKILKNRSKSMFFKIFARFLRSYAKTDVTSSFLDIVCSISTFLELAMTLRTHLGIGYRPGMSSASGISRFLEARESISGAVLAIS